jgi:hypothetical protein
LRAWRERSSLILDHFFAYHEETLADLGLERALSREQVGDFLQTLPASFTVPLHSGSGILDSHRLKRTAEIDRLIERAHRLRDVLWAEMDDAVSFLLTGRVFDLPWIIVEAQDTPVGPLGTRYVIRVAAGDATAEDVRSAFNRARIALEGSDRGRALPDHVYALVAAEAEGRWQGLTWGERWKRWTDHAREWGWTEYDTMESYRAYINKLAKDHEWIRQIVRREPDARWKQAEDVVEWLVANPGWPGEAAAQLVGAERAENRKRKAMGQPPTKVKGGDTDGKATR